MKTYDFFTKTRLGLILTYGLLYLFLYNVIGFDLTMITGVATILGNQNYNE